MGEMQETLDLDAIAGEVFSLLGSGRQIAPFSSRHQNFDLQGAYRVTAKVRELREKSGENARGRKIGFTNRTIWAEYGVHAPIWGYIYDRTIHDLDGIGGEFALRGLSDPRIEPEIVFGLATAPQPGMDLPELLACIDWVAQGFEIVQSVFPDWRFAATDTVAAFGLHGALLIGPRHRLRDTEHAWAATLSGFEIELFRDGVSADRGAAANVLGGPLLALRHLIDVLAQDAHNPPLAAGEIITTGTLTRALPINAAENWSTQLSGVALGGASVRFS
ncbi:hydratase [Bradyrhizobium sp. LHD-71]|uniref:2-keto-4-pentenoate hydratase n=1 Tax=Bradyrhizobium sp. LHD-71 TaxID=3072141 RepID=UPI00280F3B83|nr:hydratase [Bradyrhizobium sp. LHD-71]MDQ8727838.1 hydratase [Bradyrhizobium sp. LHD-71]